MPRICSCVPFHRSITFGAELHALCVRSAILMDFSMRDSTGGKDGQDAFLLFTAALSFVPWSNLIWTLVSIMIMLLIYVCVCVRCYR